MRLLIANLPPDLYDKELYILLDQFGRIRSVEFVMDTHDGIFKGRAVVEIEPVNRQKYLPDLLTGLEIAGRKITVLEMPEQELRHAGRKK